MSEPTPSQPTLPNDPQPTTPVPDQLPEQPTQPPLEEPPLQEPPLDDPARPDGEVLGAPTPQGSGQLERDPEEWVTGDDPATEAQKAYLDRLASAAGEQIPADGLTKAQASEHIDRLQAQTGMQPRRS